MYKDVCYRDKLVRLYMLHNNNGMEVDITNFGARIVALKVPDSNCVIRDVVQGFDTLDDYFPENHLSDFGAVIGRYANRIANGRIVVDGIEYQLPQNNGPNCLHGGPLGWQYAVYEVLEHTDNTISMSMVSPDGDNGFPGTVHVSVKYSLDDDNNLRIDYSATSDAPTVINMTNHSYFNLNGDGCSSIHNHLLWIDADKYTPVDFTMIPLESHCLVDGTPMDFRVSKPVGRDIDSDYEQLRLGKGYDHNWVLNTCGSLERPCARLESPISGIVMEVYTTSPGMQVYTGNFLDGVVGKNGTSYLCRSAICLETQQYPDSPNRQWPESTGRLSPEKPFYSTTIYKFNRKTHGQ
ncbi:MAG: galactose mutarotase [Bacteroidales bacterium]|nr:galactose mutarotase [Bacteroidales bacterium]